MKRQNLELNGPRYFPTIDMLNRKHRRAILDWIENLMTNRNLTKMSFTKILWKRINLHKMSKASGLTSFNRLRARWLFCCRNANYSHQIHFRVFWRRWPLIDARRSKRSEPIDAECGCMSPGNVFFRIFWGHSWTQRISVFVLILLPFSIGHPMIGYVRVRYSLWWPLIVMRDQWSLTIKKNILWWTWFVKAPRLTSEMKSMPIESEM